MADTVIRPHRASSPSRRRRRPQSRAAVLVLTLPFGILFLAFFVAPTAFAVVQSLFAQERSGLYTAPRLAFVGLKNYITAVTDPALLAALGRIVVFGLGPTVVMTLVALALALLIDARKPGPLTSFFRLVSFAPYAVPVVIGTITWGFVYSPTTSPILQGLATAGIVIDPLSPDNLTAALGIIVIWTYAGFNMMLFLAQLHTIDASLYEAARIDGASEVWIALRVKLPMIRPALLLSAMMSAIGTIQLFTEPQTLRSITASVSSTWSPAMLAYQAANTNNYSYAATVSVIIALIAGAASYLVLRTSKGSA